MNESGPDSFASDACHSMDNPGGKSPRRSFVDDFVEGKTPENSTSPANVSDLLGSSSPEHQSEPCMEERPIDQNTTSDMKDEPRDLLDKSLHINASPLCLETMKNTLGLEDGSVNERKVDEEFGDMGGVPNKEEVGDSEAPVHVILVMKLEGYPVRKLRLKSTQAVIVAMKKFATASGFNYKELR